MLSRVKRWRPQPATIISCIALFVALSGVAYAASLPKNSVGTKQIKKNAVTSSKIKAKNVANSDLKDSAVDSIKVKDASLTGGDLDAGVNAALANATAQGPIATATSTDAFAIPGLAFSDVPGMSFSYTVPAGATKLLATYSAECAVTAAATSQYVSVRILVDGVEAAPAGGSLNQMCTADSTTADAGVAQPVDASIQRVATVAPGVHTVTVQAAEVLIATGTLDDMILSAVSGP